MLPCKTLNRRCLADLKTPLRLRTVELSVENKICEFTMISNLTSKQRWLVLMLNLKSLWIHKSCFPRSGHHNLRPPSKIYQTESSDRLSTFISAGNTQFRGFFLKWSQFFFVIHPKTRRNYPYESPPFFKFRLLEKEKGIKIDRQTDRLIFGTHFASDAIGEIFRRRP